jgi:hypothetical protein
MPFGSLGLGLGLGSGKKVQLVPEVAPPIYFDVPGDIDVLLVAWDNHPTEGDIDTLVEAGLIEYTGGIDAYYLEDYTYISSGYWGFFVYFSGSLTIKNFDKLTMLFINGGNWDYNGPLPKDLIYLNLYNIKWSYSGPLPTNLTDLDICGSNINWSYSGPLPTNLTDLDMNGNNINWNYSGSLPTNLKNIYLNGNNINWTGYEIGNADITYLGLHNFRINKMTDTEMLTLLASLTNRTGSLPSTISIGDYINYQNPPQSVQDAIDLLKTTKKITTVNLYA